MLSPVRDSECRGQRDREGHNREFHEQPFQVDDLFGSRIGELVIVV